MTTCKECGSEITLPDDVVENEIIDCEACGVELEVVKLDPLEIDLAPEEQEDWGE
ncbi:MAG: lysine biosynthesis protein LysW [Candidatus Neomarinimicrobiota bacterium]|nr:lysine biosynthesis protein LysW [Candidatus Neomarinimicrobiota bacterium]